MSSFNDLIKELLLAEADQKKNNNNSIDDNDEDHYYDRRLNSAESVYDRLSTDFPTISNKQLKLLIDDLISRFETLDKYLIKNNNVLDKESQLPSYKLNNILLNTLSENTLKYNSKQQQQQQQTQQHEKQVNDKINKEQIEFANSYSSIYYLFYIKLLKYILRVNNSNELLNYLDRYYIDEESDYSDDGDDESVNDSDIEEINSNIKERNDDNDDEDNYKDFNSGSIDITKEFYDAKYGSSASSNDSWSDICVKLNHIYKQSFCYDHLSQDIVWEDYSIFEDIKDIVNSLFINEHLLPLVSLIPLFIYLLRDRILSKPNELVYVLPQLLDILLNSNSIKENDLKILSTFQINTLLSLFDSLVSIPIKSMSKRTIEYLNQSIIDNLPHLVNRLSYWNSIDLNQIDYINNNSADEISIISRIILFIANQNVIKGWDQIYLQKGLFTQYLTLLLKFINNKEKIHEYLIAEPLNLITNLCCLSEMLCKFMQKVPEFKLLLNGQEKEKIVEINDEGEQQQLPIISLKDQFIEYYAVWRYLSAVYPVNIKTITNDQKEKLENEFIGILNQLSDNQVFAHKNLESMISLTTSIQLIVSIRGVNHSAPVMQCLSKIESKIVENIKNIILIQQTKQETTNNNNSHHTSVTSSGTPSTRSSFIDDGETEVERNQERFKQQLIQVRSQLKSISIFKDLKKN